MCVSTHWGQVMHICISKLTTIGSDNGFLPVQSQAIIWTSAGIWLTGNLGTKFSEILIDILIFLFWKCVWKWHGSHFVMASVSWKKKQTSAEMNRKVGRIHILFTCNNHHFLHKVPMLNECYSEKAWASDLNGITQRGRLADGYI